MKSATMLVRRQAIDVVQRYGSLFDSEGISGECDGWCRGKDSQWIVREWKK